MQYLWVLLSLLRVFEGVCGNLASATNGEILPEESTVYPVDTYRHYACGTQGVACGRSVRPIHTVE